MNATKVRPVSAVRALRLLNVEPTMGPETSALHELIRSHIDDTVVRAQRNLNDQRDTADAYDAKPEFVYARGGINLN